MSEKFILREGIDGYVTNIDSADKKAERYLVAGSQNILIDPRFSKFGIRGGYSRLGAANTTAGGIRQSFTWNTSTGTELPIQFYDDEMEVYLGTVSGVAVNAWKRVMSGLSTTAIPRAANWWDTAENLDLCLFVQGNDNIYEWSGGITTIASATSNTITKNGTNTWAQDRFLTAGTRKVTINGTDYTYTGGETTATLTGVTPNPSSEAADSLAIQTVITEEDHPVADWSNDYIYVNQDNMVFIGSDSYNEVYVSQYDDYTDYTYSSPRLFGEGWLFPCDGPCKGFSTLSGKPLMFMGKDSIFTITNIPEQTSSVLAERLYAKKLKVGVMQGAYNQETIVPVGDSVIYLTNEPALRMLETVDTADQPQLKSLSNPIKPDFDAETWTNACAIWHKSRYYITSPTNSKTYILEYMETADGGIRRFWHTPMLWPMRSFSIISGNLYGHSSQNSECYLLFTGMSDGVYDGMDVEDKMPIQAIAKLAYRNFRARELYKNHDEFYVEGNISSSTTDLKLTLNYDFGGFTQSIERLIDGSKSSILYETIEGNSLGQQPFGTEPLGGTITESPTLKRFRVYFEMPKEDYNELQEVYETNDVDKSWEIIAGGPNAKISPRKNLINR